MSGENDEKPCQILPNRAHQNILFAPPDTIEPTLDSPWSSERRSRQCRGSTLRVVACSVRACSLGGKRSVIWAGSSEESRATGEMSNCIV